MGTRIGELLCRLVSLSDHDIEEILEEQRYTGRRFGEIALAWGLCTPADVWQAWSDQLGQGVQYVNLKSVGVDTQALSLLPGELAERYEVIPLRAVGNRLILAASEASLARAQAELPGQMNMDLRFVVVDPAQLRRAIEAQYDAEQVEEPATALAGAA
jgi:type IV pilus assembly protein PilB